MEESLEYQESISQRKAQNLGGNSVIDEEIKFNVVKLFRLGGNKSLLK